MKHLVLFVLLLTTTLSAAELQYQVQFHVKGEGAGPDTFVINKNTLQSSVIEKHYKFKPGPCTISADKKDKHVQYLKAVLSSKQHGTVTITGVISADGHIAGMRVWSKPGKQPINACFYGYAKATVIICYAAPVRAA